MPVYRPWRFAPREDVRRMQQESFRNNAAITAERQAAQRPENPLDAYRGSGGTADPLAQTSKKGHKSPLAKLGGMAKEIGSEALDAGLTALDAPAKYGLRPLLGATTYLGADRKIDENGQAYRESPSWSDIGSGFKEALTQNPIDTYREGKQAFEERTRDPKLTAGGRVLLSQASDPINLVGPGAGKAVFGAEALKGSRALRVAADLVEAPRAVAVGSVAGSALAAEGAERAGMGPKGQTIATIAGGLAGGVGLGYASRVRPPSGVDFEDVNPKRVGKETTVKSKQGDVKFRYRLVNLDDLTVSHDPFADFTENPAYKQEIQPRKRDSVAGKIQVEGIGAELDPVRMLAETGDLQNGVPIIGPDGLVESGNGRTMGTMLAAKGNPKGYAAYVKALSDKLPELGIDKNEIAGMERPYLVRERITPVDRVQFADEANDASTLRMGTVETAKADARRIPDTLIHNLEIPENATLDTFLNSAKASDFRRSFMASLSENERSALMDANGVINAAGAERLKAAFFAKTYPGPVGERLLADFFESSDPAVKNVRNGMEASLPAVARLEAGIRAGSVAPELALGEDVAAAADAFAKLKSGQLKFKTVEDYLAQTSMFGDEMELSPNAKEILRFMNDNAKSGKQIREALNGYANDALSLPPPSQADLFGGVGPGQGFAEVWKRATGRVMPAEAGQQGGLDMGSGRVDLNEPAAAPAAEAPSKPAEAPSAPKVGDSFKLPEEEPMKLTKVEPTDKGFRVEWKRGRNVFTRELTTEPDGSLAFVSVSGRRYPVERLAAETGPTSAASSPKRPSKVVSPDSSASSSETSTPQMAPGVSEEPAASSALISAENESNPNASSARDTFSEASRDASSGMDESVPPRQEAPSGPPPPLTGKGDFEALGLDPKGNYTADEVKAAYRAQSRRYHPDVNNSATASEDMKRINQAYDRMRGRQEAGPRPGKAGSRYQQRDDWKKAWDQAYERARAERAEFDRERAEYMKAREGKVGEGTPGRPTGGVGGNVGEPPLVPPEGPPIPPPTSPTGKGGTPKFGEEPPVDLFKMGTRKENIAAATAKQATRLTKLGNDLKAMFGHLSSEDVRTKVDPFIANSRFLDSKVEHIAEQMVTFERIVLKESGLEAVPDADGVWHLHADGRDVGLFDDVIEGTSDAGRAGRTELSDVQNSALDLIRRDNEALNGNIRYHGGKPKIDPEIEGDYFGRRVIERRVETKDGTNTIERGQGNAQPRSVGANRMKSRTMENVESLLEKGFRTEDPWTARLAITRGKLMTAQDAYVSKALKPLRVKKPGSTFGLASVADHPAFNGSWFEPEVARRIAKGLEAPERGIPEKFIKAINATLTPLRASFDLSASLQQGLRAWLTDPKAAADIQWEIMRSLKDDDLYDKLLLRLNSEGPGLDYLTSTNLRFTGHGTREEFALPAVFENKLRNAKGPVSAVAKPASYVFDRSNEHFSRTLNAYRIHMANNQYKRLVAMGLDGNELDAAMGASNTGINRAFGWTAAKPTTIEEAALFAPRYTRAAVETLVKAISDRGIEGNMARQHMGLMLAEGAALVFLLNTARGKETEFDPRDPNFLRIRDVGGVDVTPFGTYNTLFRAIAQSAAPEEGVMDAGARVKSMWRLAEGKMSPGMKLVYEPFIARQTYLGEPLDPLGSKEGALKAFKEEFKSTVPFGVQNLAEEGPVAAGIGSLGVGNTPMTPAEKRDGARQSHARDMFGADYDSLTGSQKAQVNEQADVSSQQEKVDDRALRSAGDSGRSTQIRKQVETELAAAMTDLSRGTDESGKEFTGNDFRKAYNDTMLRASGARALLTYKGGDEAINGWFDLYKQATMPNGQIDYDKLEGLQSNFRTAHPGIDEKVDKTVGIRDNAAVRELRQAKKLASTYYNMPAYRGMTIEESDRAQGITNMANDMVSFGQARNRADALRQLAARDSEGTRLARRAANAGPNPEREKFRKANPLFAKYYSDIAPTLIK